MNIRLLFVTFYGLIEYVERIVTSFNELKNTPKSKLDYVDEFPYLKSKNDDGLTDSETTELLITKITTNRVTHVFWFFFPEGSALETVKTKTNVKNVFYNFDDPMSFNIFLVKNANFIDYFINPILSNEKKYTYVLDKKIHTVEMYSDKIKYFDDDILQDDRRIMILVDDYDKCDDHEKTICENYIHRIKNICVEMDMRIDLYGCAQLELLFPELYVDNVDSLEQMLYLIKNKIVILLDFKIGLNKSISSVLKICTEVGNHHLSNAKLSLELNTQEYLTQTENIINKNQTIYLNDMSNLTNAIKNKELFDQNENDDQQTITVSMWAKQILNILKNHR